MDKPEYTAEEIKKISSIKVGLTTEIRQEPFTKSELLYHTFACEFINLLPLKKFNTILDAGSGNGLQSKYFMEQEKDVTSVDLLLPKVELPKFYQDDITALPFEAGLFDAVWSHHTVEHLLNPVLGLMELRRVTKPTGYLFITVPQIDKIMSTGHINSYNLQLLMYQLAATGWNTRDSFFTKQRSHLRAMVVADNDYCPNLNTLILDLPTLAKMKLFPDKITKEIEETGRFEGKSFKSRWFNKIETAF